MYQYIIPLVQATEEEATINVTLLKFLMPIFLFLFVFALIYAILKKTGILGEAPMPMLLISFVIAIIFIVTPATVRFTHVITPWMVVFIISLLFIFLILSFTGFEIKEGISGLLGKEALGWSLLIIFIVIFIFSGIAAFGPILSPFAPGGNETATGVIQTGVKATLFHPAVLGVALLFVIAAVTAWVLGQK